MDWIDLRSDTVTRPSHGMRRAMAEAEVGDDVFGDDPTVNRLQRVVAERFRMEDALFFPSGTQSNLAAVMAHCQRGEEMIVGQEAHTYRYEGGGAAVLGSVQPQPLQNRPDGTLDLGEVETAIKPDDSHFAITRLLALENTIGGKVIGRDYLEKAAALARRRGLALHLDGARIFNASVKLGVPVDRLCAGFDTVSVCLSKGLGTPAGTVLVGRREVIEKARRVRKMLGGTMRQSGILAAAGLYALEHNVERLAEDHANAERLGRGLAALGLEVEPVQPNKVFVRVPGDSVGAVKDHLDAAGVAVMAGPRMRLVTHLDVDAAGIGRAVEAVAGFLAAAPLSARSSAERPSPSPSGRGQE